MASLAIQSATSVFFQNISTPCSKRSQIDGRLASDFTPPSFALCSRKSAQVAPQRRIAIVADGSESVVDKAKSAVDDVASRVQEGAGQAGQAVKDVATDVDAQRKSVASGLEKDAENVASKGEHAAKAGVDSVKDASAQAGEKVESESETPRNFVNHDAARDEAFQEEGPGSDPVPKDSM
eukprot:TRINITY_DN731_c0_g2_i1.p1 TRINITY_DN731_c0_g2~~TRINITY_DN731_c0_g2_i1.p1  ORF type:complete len:180 (+),score=34.05 TRINITY_DN731_c0_g2_i1:213-752(+)